VDNLLVGRFVGSRGLGLYVKAYSLLLMPLMHVNQPLSTVVVPALSRLRNEPERFLAYYRRALSLVAMTTLPVALFAAVAARQIIGVVLGPRWEASADIFALLSPAAACASLGVATGWVYMAFGHLDRQLRVRLVTSALGLAAMCVGVRWGVRGMAVAVSTAALVFQWPQLMICYRGTPVSVRELFAAVAMPAGAALLAAAAVLGVAAAAGLDGTGLKELAVKTAVFGGVYALPFAATRGGRQRLRMLYDALRVLR
jgi:PST family polysaccharide transporter